MFDHALQEAKQNPIIASAASRAISIAGNSRFLQSSIDTDARTF